MIPAWMRREATFHVFQTRLTWQVRGEQFGATRHFKSFDLAMGAARTAAAACGVADSAKTLLRVWPDPTSLLIAFGTLMTTLCHRRRCGLFPPICPK